MTIPRCHVVTDSEAIYHCHSRCVRRAFLCGSDPITRRSYDYRKKWIEQRMQLLKAIFCIEVLGYAVLDNHFHCLLRTRPDELSALSPEEVLTRWLTLYPHSSRDRSTGELASEEVFQALLSDRERIEVLRTRLGSLSWYMKSVKEYIARRANKEESCSGRFWEGRFKSKRLHGEPAVLAAAMYVDLNPVRANIAKTPEESRYTSVYARIKAHGKVRSDQLWLCPVNDIGSKRGFLSIDFPTYLTLLDETGRLMKKEKRGSISDDLAPILARIGIKADHWVSTVENFDLWFGSAAGSADELIESASKTNKKWIKGVGRARIIFTKGLDAQKPL